MRQDIFTEDIPTRVLVDGITGTRVRLSADDRNLASRNGQTVTVTLAILLAMMGTSIELDIESTPLVGSQPPLRGNELLTGLQDLGADLIPGVGITTRLRRPDITFAIGDTPSSQTPVVRVSGGEATCTVGSHAPARQWAGDQPFGALMAAATAAAEALRIMAERVSVIAGVPLTCEHTYELSRHSTLQLPGLSGTDRQSLDLGRVDFVSAGAITTAALYCLLRVPHLGGRLRIVDDAIFELTNLNRYPLMRRSDSGRVKVDILRGASADGLEISGVNARFDEKWQRQLGELSPLVVVGADEIPVRWRVQRADPAWLCVGATSHFMAMVSTHESMTPCAGCTHPRNDIGPGAVEIVPTISFVSFWGGLMQAVQLVARLAERPAGDHWLVWPLGLGGSRPILFGSTAPTRDCPVGCLASMRARPRGAVPTR